MNHSFMWSSLVFLHQVAYSRQTIFLTIIL
jgi:hypothetical protein